MMPLVAAPTTTSTTNILVASILGAVVGMLFVIGVPGRPTTVIRDTVSITARAIRTTPAFLLLFASKGTASALTTVSRPVLFTLPSVSIASALYFGLWILLSAEMIFFIGYSRRLPRPARTTLVTRLLQSQLSIWSPVWLSLTLLAGCIGTVSILAIAVFCDPAVISDMFWGSIITRTDVPTAACTTVAYSTLVALAAESAYFLCCSRRQPKHQRSTFLAVINRQLFPAPSLVLLPDVITKHAACLHEFDVVGPMAALLSVYYVFVPESIHASVCRLLLQLMSLSLAISSAYILSLPGSNRYRSARAAACALLAFGPLAVGGRGKATSPSVAPLVAPSVNIAKFAPAITGSQRLHCSSRQHASTLPRHEAVVYDTHIPYTTSNTYKVTALPDNQANVTVVNRPEYLIDARPVTKGSGFYADGAQTASKHRAKVTHTGRLRFGIRDAAGNTAAVTTDAICIPTQRHMLLGTNLKSSSPVRFDTVNWNMTCSMHDVTIPVAFDSQRNYHFEVVINPQWPDTRTQPLATVSAYNTPSSNASAQHASESPTKSPKFDVPDLVSPSSSITFSEYFGGVGHATYAWKSMNFAPVTYFDSSLKKAFAYSDAYPHVPQWSDIASLTNGTSDFLDADKISDVVIAGAPCADHTHLNSYRDENSTRSRLIIDAVKLFLEGQHKIGVFEAVPAFTTAHDGRLFNEFMSLASPQYSVVPLLMDPRDHGGIQTRKRWYFVLVRADITKFHGAFPAPSKSPTTRTLPLQAFLDPVHEVDLVSLHDNREFVRRHNTTRDNPTFRGAHADFVVPLSHRRPGDNRNNAYAITGACPTITTNPPTIFDSRPGMNLFRFLSPREVMRCQGFNDDFHFPESFTDSDVYSAIGMGMDIHCLRALGSCIDGYLHGTTAPQAPLVCHYTNTADRAFLLHCRNGHPSEDVSRRMRLPKLKTKCPLCPLGKSRHAVSKTAPVTKAKAALDRVHLDMKISSKPDRHGVTRMLCFVDSFSNDSWCKPLSDGTSSTIIRAIREWLVSDLQNEPVKTLVLDNDPAFCSQEFIDFLENDVKIPRWYSCAYHQHQNGVAEAYWARATPRTIIACQAAPWLGLDYWTEAMQYVNECMRRQPSYANPNHEAPMLLSTGSVRTDILRQWGSVCYVHDEKASGFKVKARKAYFLGLSPLHADGVYKVLMCDSKRIRHTMNCIFHESTDVSAPELPDTMEFQLSSKKPASPLPGCAGCADVAVQDAQVEVDQPAAAIDDNHGELADVGPDIPPPLFDDTVPVLSKRCKYPLNARLQTGDLSRITSIHGRARVTALHGLTVSEALTMSYFVGGKYKRYVNQDLNYDVNNGSLLVLDAASPIVNDTKVAFDTTPLLPIKQHVDGIGIDAVSSSFFSAEAETAIRIHADNDPMIDLGGWGVRWIL